LYTFPLPFVAENYWAVLSRKTRMLTIVCKTTANTSMKDNNNNDTVIIKYHNKVMIVKRGI
jgi:hypothetical protein